MRLNQSRLQSWIDLKQLTHARARRARIDRIHACDSSTVQVWVLVIDESRLILDLPSWFWFSHAAQCIFYIQDRQLSSSARGRADRRQVAADGWQCTSGWSEDGALRAHGGTLSRAGSGLRLKLCFVFRKTPTLTRTLIASSGFLANPTLYLVLLLSVRGNLVHYV